MPRIDEEPMSAPNSDYDPVEVSSLSQEALDGYAAEALAAFAAASDLAELKLARLAHSLE